MLNVYDVKKSMNEQKCSISTASGGLYDKRTLLTELSSRNWVVVGCKSYIQLWVRGQLKMCKTAFSVFPKNSRKCDSKVWTYCFTCIEYIYRYQNCIDSVVLISTNVMWKIRNEVHKTFFSELNILTVWYATSVSVFMGWYLASCWEDCRYFYCFSQSKLLKGKSFPWSVPKIINLESLLKSALTGKYAFKISSRSCPSFILCFLSPIW